MSNGILENGLGEGQSLQAIDTSPRILATQQDTTPFSSPRPHLLASDPTTFHRRARSSVSQNLGPLTESTVDVGQQHAAPPTPTPNSAKERRGSMDAGALAINPRMNQSKQAPSNLPPLLLPMPSLVSNNTPPSRKGNRIATTGPQQPKTPTSTGGSTYFTSPAGPLPNVSSSSTSLAVKTPYKDQVSFGHVRSQSSVNLSSAMKEARDVQYRHSKMPSTSLSRPNTMHSDNLTEPGRPRAYTQLPSPPSTDNKRFQRNSFNLGDISALKMTPSSNSKSTTLVPSNNNLLAPPNVSLLSRRKSATRQHRESDHLSDSDHHNFSIRHRNSASSLLSINSNDSGESSVSSEVLITPHAPLGFLSETITDTPERPRTESSFSARSENALTPRLFDRNVSMATGVSELKAHLSSTLTSNISDSENGLKQQLMSFESTLAELKELHSRCSNMVSTFVSTSETSDAATQKRLKDLRDQMSAFKILDSLETRIAAAHATIDANKKKLDTVNQWVALKEAKTRLWRKRVRAARRVITISLLVLLLAIFLFKALTNSSPGSQEYWALPTPSRHGENLVKIVAESDPISSLNPNAPLEEIVSWLGDIDKT